MTGTGLASVSVNINDDVQPSYGVPSGVCAVIGYTKFGEVGVPTLIETTAQFISKFGGVTVDGDFAHSCLIALEAGAKLLVSRLTKYTVADSLWTPTGAKASLGLFDTDGTTVYTTVSSTSESADGNDLMVAILQNDLFDEKVNIWVYKNGSLINEVKEQNKVLSQSDFDTLNQKLSAVQFSQTDKLIITSGFIDLAGGSDPVAPQAIDYIGNKAARTGVFSFDEYNNFDFIAAFGIAQNSVDVALSNYVTERGDCQAILRSPVSLVGSGVVAYRKAVSPYAGTIVNNWRARMTTGGIKVSSKLSSSVTVTMSESPLYVAALCRKNATGKVWQSVGAAQYCYLERVLGVSQNFLSSGRATEADLVVNNGVVPIVQMPNGKVRIFGDSTMQRESGFLQNANVADTIAFITNEVKGIYNKYLFEPNDIPTWRLMHIDVTNFLKTIVDGGGIRTYRYKGDQDANSFDSLTVNNADDIADGKYKVVIDIYPTSVMKHIEIAINLTANLTTTVSVSA